MTIDQARGLENPGAIPAPVAPGVWTRSLE
jgi:hypothetical protein